jgi:hypothetical protein
MCIVYLSIYRYRVQELTDDSRQMIKSETDTDRQPVRTHVRAGHDEHTQKGTRRAQEAARRHLKGKG